MGKRAMPRAGTAPRISVFQFYPRAARFFKASRSRAPQGTQKNQQRLVDAGEFQFARARQRGAEGTHLALGDVVEVSRQPGHLIYRVRPRPVVEKLRRHDDAIKTALTEI